MQKISKHAHTLELFFHKIYVYTVISLYSFYGLVPGPNKINDKKHLFQNYFQLKNKEFLKMLSLKNNTTNKHFEFTTHST